MFFKKSHIQEITVNPEDAPVYLLGNNALTCFLGAKLQLAGQRVVIIANPETNFDIETNGVIIKEDHSLQKTHFKFNTSIMIDKAPKFVILSADSNNINAYLAGISLKKIKDVPILLFTNIKDFGYIKELIGNNIHRANLDGYLDKNDQIINVSGRAPNIHLCLDTNDSEQMEITEIFQKTGLNIILEENEKECFWKFFAPYAISSLVPNTKDKQFISSLIDEMAEIALKDNFKLNPEEVSHKIFTSPSNYVYPLQKALKSKKAGDLNFIASTITNPKTKAIELNKLIKNIHNIILA